MGDDYFYASEWNYDSDYGVFNGNFFDEKAFSFFNGNIYCRYVRLFYYTSFFILNGWPNYPSDWCWCVNAINDDNIYVNFPFRKTWVCNGNGWISYFVCTCHW